MKMKGLSAIMALTFFLLLVVKTYKLAVAEEKLYHCTMALQQKDTDMRRAFVLLSRTNWFIAPASDFITQHRLVLSSEKDGSGDVISVEAPKGWFFTGDQTNQGFGVRIVAINQPVSFRIGSEGADGLFGGLIEAKVGQ